MDNRKEAWMLRDCKPVGRFPRVMIDAVQCCSPAGLLSALWKTAMWIYGRDKTRAAACLHAMIDEIAERGNLTCQVLSDEHAP